MNKLAKKEAQDSLKYLQLNLLLFHTIMVIDYWVKEFFDTKKKKINKRLQKNHNKYFG